MSNCFKLYTEPFEFDFNHMLLGVFVVVIEAQA